MPDAPGAIPQVVSARQETRTAAIVVIQKPRLQLPKVLLCRYISTQNLINDSIINILYTRTRYQVSKEAAAFAFATES